MEPSRLLSFVGTSPLVLGLVLSGCTTPPDVPYPGDWAVRAIPAASDQCANVSGTYQALGDGALLPPYLFGLWDTKSSAWADALAAIDRVATDGSDAAVTLGFVDPDRLEVRVAVRGIAVTAHKLARSFQSPDEAAWLGTAERTFRCEREAIVITGTRVFHAPEHRLPVPEKQRRFPESLPSRVGTAAGSFRFARAVDGSLVMHEHLIACSGTCQGFGQDRWLRWAPVTVQPSPAARQIP